MRYPKLCVTPGCPRLRVSGTRCRLCARAYEADRNTDSGRDAYADPLYRQRRKEVRAGMWGPCVDCGSRDDLTIDHRTPLAAAGRNTPDNWVVRCRTCNIRKGPRMETR